MEVGNNILFGNTVRATIIIKAYGANTQRSLAFGQYELDVTTLVPVGTTSTITTVQAPVVALTTSAVSAANLALSDPDPSGNANGCSCNNFFIINTSGNLQPLANAPGSNIIASDGLELQVDCATLFYYAYNATPTSWIQTGVLA